MNRRRSRQILGLFAQALALGLAVTAVGGELRAPNRPLGIAAQSGNDIASLEIGKPVERSLKAGETHTYSIKLAAGQFLRAVIQQRGIDVVASVSAPDGKLLVEVDSPNGQHGPELILLVADASVTYHLVVRPLEKEAAAGHYEVKIEELRSATAQDRSRVAAQRADAEALSLFLRGALRESLEKYQEALPLYRAAGDSSAEAITLNSIGRIHYERGERREALAHFTQALSITRARRDVAGEAATLSNIGAIYDELGEKQKALETFEQALRLRRTVADRRGEAITLNNIGRVYADLGDRQKALEYFARALELQDAGEDSPGKATVLDNLGTVYGRMGDSRQAIYYYGQALALYRKARERGGEAATLSNICSLYNSLDDRQKALDYCAQALEMWRTLKDRSGEAVTLINLGLVHSGQGDKQRALALYTQALPIYRELGDHYGEATALNNLGTLYSELGEKQKALETFEQALRLRRTVADRRGEAITLNNIGRVYADLGDRQKALEYYLQALPIWKVAADPKAEGNTLFAIGIIYESLREPARALEYYLQVIVTRERLRRAAEGRELSLSFDDTSAGVYRRAALLYLSSGRAELAFDLCERMRANNLLDQLTRGRVNSRGKVDPRLTEREAALRQEIDGLERTLKEERVKPVGNIDQNLISRLETQLAKTRGEYEDLLARIKLAAPGYASLQTASTLTVPEVQRLLPPDITLLSYMVTPDTTVAFVISRDIFQAITIPVKEGDLFDIIREFRTFPTLKTWRADKLQRLHQHLIAPVQKYLKTPVVGIVPHGPLHYLSFSALTNGVRYLDEEHTLFYLPSASLISHVIKNQRKGADGLLAVAYSRPEGRPVLAGADREVKAIVSSYGGRLLVGDAATEDRVRDLAGNHGVLHLAAHYELNTESPLLSRLVLAPDNNDNGFLEVHEVFDLNLARTHLVVLSASQTHLGKQTEGDDLIALDRAFFYAGAGTVVASLWNVDDEATSWLMVSFYKHLKEGSSKAMALREAQRETRAKYPNPYYWAAFILTGDPGN